MINTQLNIPAAVQRSIINNATVSVKRFAKDFSNRLGRKRFFSAEDIEDIIGNTIYKACRSFGTFDHTKAGLSTWTARIARNCVLDAADYRMKRLGISNEFSVEFAESGDILEISGHCGGSCGTNRRLREMIDENDADRDLEVKEFEEGVRAECSRLSEKNRRFLGMLEEGLGPKDMARQEGCSADAAAKRVFVIRKTLRKPISELADEFGVTGMRRAS